jgi:hypothetical protein
MIQADRWTNEHTGFDVAAALFWDNEKPAVAVGAPGYLFTYEGISLVDFQPPRHIYGVLWWPSVINLPLILRQ